MHKKKIRRKPNRPSKRHPVMLRPSGIRWSLHHSEGPSGTARGRTGGAGICWSPQHSEELWTARGCTGVFVGALGRGRPTAGRGGVESDDFRHFLERIEKIQRKRNRGLCRHYRHRSAPSGHLRSLLLGHQRGAERAPTVHRTKRRGRGTPLVPTTGQERAGLPRTHPVGESGRPSARPHTSSARAPRAPRYRGGRSGREAERGGLHRP